MFTTDADRLSFLLETEAEYAEFCEHDELSAEAVESTPENSCSSGRTR